MRKLIIVFLLIGTLLLSPCLVMGFLAVNTALFAWLSLDSFFMFAWPIPIALLIIYGLNKQFKLFDLLKQFQSWQIYLAIAVLCALAGAAATQTFFGNEYVKFLNYGAAFILFYFVLVPTVFFRWKAHIIVRVLVLPLMICVGIIALAFYQDLKTYSNDGRTCQFGDLTVTCSDDSVTAELKNGEYTAPLGSVTVDVELRDDAGATKTVRMKYVESDITSMSPSSITIKRPDSSDPRFSIKKLTNVFSDLSVHLYPVGSMRMPHCFLDQFIKNLTRRNDDQKFFQQWTYAPDATYIYDEQGKLLFKRPNRRFKRPTSTRTL